MLIMHGSLYVSMTHCAHDSSQVPGSHKDPSAVVMTGTIENQFFRKPGLLPRLSKQAIDGAQVTRSRTLGRKHPAFCPCAAPCTQELEDAAAHRYKSPVLPESCCPAQRSRDFPNRDLRCACGRVPFGSSSLSHQDHDIAEEFKGSPPPRAGLSSFEQSLFRVIVKPKVPPMLLHHFDFWSMTDHLPLLRFVEYSP